MIHIKTVENPDEKTDITRQIMYALPAWFSPPEDIESKAVIHRDYPFISAFDEDKPIGFIALKIHNEFTADIYVIGVLEQYHRQGVGALLVEAAQRYCESAGHTCLTVKTLDASADYEPYVRTRNFYKKMGFIPLEVFTHYWNEENPCLFLVKYLVVQKVSILNDDLKLFAPLGNQGRADSVACDEGNVGNLFELPELPLPEELTTVIARGENIRIERIVSTGQTSRWYDQDENEFVALLEGTAELEMEGGGIITLNCGDTITIPKHQGHRVCYTSCEPPCIWLCVFWS